MIEETTLPELLATVEDDTGTLELTVTEEEDIARLDDAAGTESQRQRTEKPLN